GALSLGLAGYCRLHSIAGTARSREPRRHGKRTSPGQSSQATRPGQPGGSLHTGTRSSATGGRADDNAWFRKRQSVARVRGAWLDDETRTGAVANGIDPPLRDDATRRTADQATLHRIRASTILCR